MRRTVPALSAGIAAISLLAFGLVTLPAAEAQQGRSLLERPDALTQVTVQLPGSDALDALNEAGFDVAPGPRRVPDGVEADVFVSADQVPALEGLGAEVLADDEVFSWDETAAPADTAAAPADADAPPSHEATVRIARADWFTTKGQGFLYVEARTTEGAQEDPVVAMTLRNDTGEGTDFVEPRTMSRFTDSGEYMFHRNLYKLDVRPSQIEVVSSTGGVATGSVNDWLEDAPPPLTDAPGYESDFVDGYQHPQQLEQRYLEIAAEYPDITEIVELPYETNGYQRKAQAVLGDDEESAVVVSSTAWGHEGGNDVSVSLESPDAADHPLAVHVDGSALRVELGTDADGSPTSTVDDVAAAITTHAGDLIDRAHPYQDADGSGIVAPTDGPVALTDFLDQKQAGAPEGEAPRGPKTIKVLRIGKHLDGSKPGVLIQPQDHAREWVPPTATLEAAERLVNNYATDAETRHIVDNTDIFLIPVNNPDGANYSFFNYNMQRKNMTNHCPDESAAPDNRNSWGVDLNRNYRVGSAQDGYAGGSFVCTSGTYQGPEKLSEPEAQNSVWLAETYPNIKFMMSVHSNGGQLFWQPGAYKADGRVTTPRPPLGDEEFYWQAASRILSQVKAYRETVVTPENVGGSSDVLYSSAGNVREDMYHTYGIYAFGWEVGGSTYNPETGEWQRGSFQPPWEASEHGMSGHSETLEYANGLMEMFRVAADWGNDHVMPRSSLTTEQVTGGVDVRFDTNEPATIYYTTDGTRPTLDSQEYEAEEFREGGETLYLTDTTTFQWFSVDASGNVERGYNPDPDARGRNFRSMTVQVDG